MLIPFTECIICNAEAIRRDLVGRVGLPGRKLMVIRNGVIIPPMASPDQRTTARRLLGAADDEIVVGTIARLSQDKNLGMLAEAASMSRDTSPRLRFYVVGTGPDEDEVRAAIRERGVE